MSEPLNPYEGEEPEDLPTGRELIDLVQFYKDTADEHGESYDPEWDKWLEEDRQHAIPRSGER